MSDFDFDELDKAVAGALTPEEVIAQNSTPTPSSEAPTPVATPIEVPSAAPVIEQRTASPLPPAARRSSGRFMDVVHPSSDMRTKTGYTPATENPVESRPTTFVAPTVEEKVDEDWSKPLESPFLPDAKVEKRPLGGAGLGAAFNPEELLEASEEELKLEEPDDPRLEATTLPDPIDFATQSTGAVTEIAEEPVVAKEESGDIETPAFEEVAESDSLVFSEPETHVVAEPVVPKVEEPTGPTSISQQYQERPSTEQVSGAIYDTESYHQPVVAAPKKRSGAWAILWIILLIILGAGAGVGFYMFVLPML